ncbi:MAG: hypothetical protein IJ368_08080 [Oscillospiraceae bacterium]|nr:hypothetical protein [Oscillospiraceae bacterium]
MKYEDFNLKDNGFSGHLAEPDDASDKAVIVIMGGEQSLLPGIKFAERFADCGIAGLAVSLFGAEGLPDSPDRCPLDMFIPAVEYLRNVKGIEHISIYGQSMGSIFAALTAQYIGGIENLIMVSPTHVPFEGTLADRKTMTGHSVVTWHGEDIPFVKADFSAVKPSRYHKHPAVTHKVMGMWTAYYNAYQDKKAEQNAWIQLEKTNARILLIAGAMDEAWPAEYSVKALQKYLKDKKYQKDVKSIIYPHGSHLNGLMPNRNREKKLYRMIPLIGFMYKTFGRYRKENMKYFEQSEKEIIKWIKG